MTDRINKRSAGGMSARVLKTVSIFGGVQMTNILCGIVKVKLVALWLGPAGVGLFGIFNGAVDMVSSISQLGVRQSAVRDIAAHRQSPMVRITVTVVRRWGWLLGLLGALLMLAASPLLSLKTFGSYDRTAAFMTLSIAVLLGAVSYAEQAVMQGLDRLKSLAKSTVWASVSSLALTVPMYYFWRLDSIIPSILTYYIVIFILVARFRPAGYSAERGVSIKETFSRGAGFVKLGFFMTAADALSQLMSYVFIAYLNNAGGDVEVGFYQSGYTIANRYVGILFSAVAVEYYPRISSVAASGWKLKTFVAHEALLITLMLLPCALLFISFAPYIVSLLYSGEFAVAVPFVTIAMVGMILRGISYSMAYVILAKGDGRTFILTESVSCVIGLALNVVSYEFFGIAGLGLSYSLWYLCYVIIIAIVYYRRYGLQLPRRIVAISAGAACMTVLAVLVALRMGSLWVLPPAIVTSFMCLHRVIKLVRH